MTSFDYPVILLVILQNFSSLKEWVFCNLTWGRWFLKKTTWANHTLKTSSPQKSIPFPQTLFSLSSPWTSSGVVQTLRTRMKRDRGTDRGDWMVFFQVYPFPMWLICLFFGKKYVLICNQAIKKISRKSVKSVPERNAIFKHQVILTAILCIQRRMTIILCCLSASASHTELEN